MWEVQRASELGLLSVSFMFLVRFAFVRSMNLTSMTEFVKVSGNVVYSERPECSTSGPQPPPISNQQECKS